MYNQNIFFNGYEYNKLKYLINIPTLLHTQLKP